MKKLLLLFTILLFILSCKKNDDSLPHATNPTILAARNFFETQVIGKTLENSSVTTIINNSPRAGDKSPAWEKATILNLPYGQGTIVPVKYAKPKLLVNSNNRRKIYSIEQLTRLFIYTDAGRQYHAELLTYLPDSNYEDGKQFSGLLLIEDWNANLIAKFKFEKNGQLLSGLQNATVQTSSTITVSTCVTISGYNYSTADPTNGVYWSESAGCSYTTYISSPTLAGGISTTSGSTYGGLVSGKGNGLSSTPTVVVAEGTNIIGSISDYEKCFTNIAGAGHVYTATLCVSQPVAGSRQAWGLSLAGVAGSAGGSNPVNVGHTFLVLAETTSTTTIKRNIGFYPATSVNPIAHIDAGQLNNDDQHAYNISLTATLTNSQFFNILSYISQNANNSYDLNSLNCTTFALRALAAGSVSLPSTVGTWTGGSGNDPGDMGEDIRNLKLASNMTRNLSFSNHPNLGTCN